MRIRQLYQTTWIRDSESIERDGPIYCKDEPWLGEGYYFWDSRVEDAHWWGEVHYKGEYMIFNSKYDRDSSEYLDLVGDVQDNNDFINICNIIIEQNQKFGIKEVTIGELIEFIKRTDSNFNYKAIKAYPISTNRLNKSKKIFYFDKTNQYQCSYLQKVQICVIDKSFLINDEYILCYSSNTLDELFV